MRCLIACLLCAWLAVAATLALGDVMACASPVSTIGKTLSDTTARTNEHPGTGYIRDPRQ